ncbi:MAG: radical SAM protein [Thermoplasmata archaeon]|nr:radical SAM protein [Thermoplasmata archaeon]TFG70898.1 MAG: radical SAM protein [Methanomassiliicoccus sp.]
MQKGSAYTGKLAPGCIMCQKGAKLVLLITGRCMKRCYYCPLSAKKKGKDFIFANELRVRSLDEIIGEAELIDALGTGITGGDPLLSIDRTVDAIRMLKKHFGDDHQIHLYTSTTDTKRIDKVARAGLDEIRFHPTPVIWRRLDRSMFAPATKLAMKRGMVTGLEIPSLPGYEDGLEAAIMFADDSGLDFVNLNELEVSETNWQALRTRGFDFKDDASSGIAGSEELALELLRMDVSVPIHYCSSAFKDGVQLRNRITRRARNVRRPHEILTNDSTLLKGVIETKDIGGTMEMLRQRFEVPRRLMFVDLEKKRLEIAAWVLEEIAGELELESFIVEEYPTADRLEVERSPLKRR